MIESAQKNEQTFIGWSFDWPTIEELQRFADANKVKYHEVKVQLEIIGGKVRIVLRGKQ